ncbi:gephyrin-like molybdotransferase Glp [Inquilinus sp. CAU 1745]|uniref:molybdopterin molybdotransferase MoeA n=1 Tax=Inquilinus sp. CAU 1745 TaxID=3140369 RepID=UPI00325A445B
MAQLTDDCFAFGGKLMRIEDALTELERRLPPIDETEAAPLTDAEGRILAADIVAGRSVPPHDNSAVDGYAVRFADLAADGPTRLPLAGRVAAGHPLADPLPAGSALRAFTGAALPSGVDTVLMQEDCEVDGDTVSIPPGIRKGANYRLAGEDVAEGSTILERGRRLRPADLGLAASIGLAELPVFRRLKVALFSTGDEVREPGTTTPEGAIYDANRFTLHGLLRRLGCEITDLGILPDDAGRLRRALGDAASGHDLLMTSGGVSGGEEDHVKQAVEQAGGAVHAWRLAIKPGRPVALGQIGSTAFIGLPGNPVAVLVTFLLVARPLLLRRAGAERTAPRLFPVTAAFGYRKKKDRREYVRVTLETGEDGRPRAVKHPRDGAGILSSVVESDGLVELGEEVTEIRPGETVSFLSFDGF